MSIFTLNDKQLIVYGAPGTGKSHSIEDSLVANGFNLISDVERVVFHRDYTYADFIGCLMPENGLTGLDYVFKPGPFTVSVERALENPDRNYCLLIEEMNRGNCGGIFGDVFQLLDRDSSGCSSYSVINVDVRNYLNKNSRAAASLARWDIGANDIQIPSNLFIIGTMNTADQNVFIMDSAFKRRFKMSYMPIIFDCTEPYLAKLDSLSASTLFADGKTWSDFAKEVNCLIDHTNADMLTISEDKKLGPYFVDEVDVSCKQAFCDKVLYYLKNDVFKYSETVFCDSFEDIYDGVVNEGNDIFELLKER